MAGGADRTKEEAVVGRLVTAAPTGYHLLVPPGWRRFTADLEGKQQLIALASAKLKPLGRPDIDAQVRTMIEQQWTRLAALRADGVYMPGDGEDDPVTPMTLAVLRQVARPGTTFADRVQELARTAPTSIETPLGVVHRWETTERSTGELEGSSSRIIGYGFPVPGARPDRGAVLLVSIPYPNDADREIVDALVELADTIAETFRWR